MIWFKVVAPDHTHIPFDLLGVFFLHRNVTGNGIEISLIFLGMIFVVSSHQVDHTDDRQRTDLRQNWIINSTRDVAMGLDFLKTEFSIHCVEKLIKHIYLLSKWLVNGSPVSSEKRDMPGLYE